MIGKMLHEIERTSNETYHHTNKYDFLQADYEKPLAEIADSKYWIPLDKFIALVRKNAISNWEQACDRQSAMCITQRISSNAHIMRSSFICFSLTAFITLICFQEVNEIGK